jgi:RNA polymerase sigma factor (sigma-70 family)
VLLEESLKLAAESDFDLIQACRRGDERAWDRLLDRYERLVHYIALKHGLSGEDAADVSQTTFTILMQSLDKLRDDTRLGAWLATVAKRHTWRVMAGRQREQVHPEDDLAGQDWALGETADPYAAWERVEWLKDGLEQLDRRCRELLRMLYFDPAKPGYPEIADHFQIALGSVGPTRARCLERLKSLMVAAVQV